MVCMGNLAQSNNTHSDVSDNMLNVVFTLMFFVTVSCTTCCPFYQNWLHLVLRDVLVLPWDSLGQSWDIPSPCPSPSSNCPCLGPLGRDNHTTQDNKVASLVVPSCVVVQWPLVLKYVYICTHAPHYRVVC